MKKIVIFGAGGGSQELVRVLIDEINKVTPTWKIVGFIDRDTQKKGSTIMGYPVIGPHYDDEPNGAFGVCGVMKNEIRESIINNEIIGNGFELATLIHPSVIRLSDFSPGSGLIIYPGSQISYNVRFGKGVFVNYNCVLGHDLIVGDSTYIGPSVTIAGGCKVGRLCTIGAGANILQGVSVSDECIVGIGTTLVKNVVGRTSIVHLPRLIENNRAD